MINGLVYVPNYLHPEEHDLLFQSIDEETWSTELKRRVQHYGYKYDYRKRSINALMAVPMPRWAQKFAARLAAYMPKQPDQMIVNEYLPGQGISAHVDCEPCFGDVIAVISLGSDYVMDFRNREDGTHIPLLLEARSLMIMSGESRYKWTHGIAARCQDIVDGRVIKRRRRVSLTFRNVILSN